MTTDVQGSRLVEVEALRFAYGEGHFALTIPQWSLERGAHVACIGTSGTGKTTLLHLLAGILLPDAGVVRVRSTVLSAMTDRSRRAFRLAQIGMVFQRFELLEYATALDNILLPYHLGVDDVPFAEARQRALQLAGATGIASLIGRKPRRLSQGEQQRVALCRALVTRPPLLFCDEPTGNLDPQTAGTVLDLLFEQARESDATLLVVTHDHSILERFDQVLDMRELSREATP